MIRRELSIGPWHGMARSISDRVSHRIASRAARIGAARPQCKLKCAALQADLSQSYWESDGAVEEKFCLRTVPSLTLVGTFAEFEKKKNRPMNPKFQNWPLKKLRPVLKSADSAGPGKWSWIVQAPTTLWQIVLTGARNSLPNKPVSMLFSIMGNYEFWLLSGHYLTAVVPVLS